MRGIAALRIGLWAVVALVAGCGARTAETAPGAPYGTPFRLVDQNNRPVTEGIFRGKPSAVFFGFTHCPEVCPTTLAELATYETEVAAKGRALNVVFVSVDPQRDTPAVLKQYVSALSPTITGITGSPDAVAAMLKGWNIYAKKVGEGDDYTMDHTASVLLLDAAGALQSTIAYGEDSKSVAAKIARIVGA